MMIPKMLAKFTSFVILLTVLACSGNEEISEELSLSIVRGMSHKITETVTAEGLVIEIA